jgi:hypothetical protein
MCNHFIVYEPQGKPTSKGVCVNCGFETVGLNGFPDDAYEHGKTFLSFQIKQRPRDNNIECILNDKRNPHFSIDNY